ncbi:MAG TPA: hypothetical protein VD994_09205 [Prosthecobacter sp.]|nr:hypothetical protein [Prosthecobacter sp.]
MRRKLIVAVLLSATFTIQAHGDCTVTVATADGGFKRQCTPQEIQQRAADDAESVKVKQAEAKKAKRLQALKDQGLDDPAMCILKNGAAECKRRLDAVNEDHPE